MKEPILVTKEERKLIFNAIRYWQMYKTLYNGKEYELCQNLLNHLYDSVYTQQKEQPT